MDQSQDCIQLKNINKTFGEKQVLYNINLSVPYGKIYGLLGPSGCGKTTTVKIMSGILEGSSGETYVLGEKMPQLSLMNRIGYMAQSDALYSGLTAEENLKFFASLYGMNKKKIISRIHEVMDLVNLKQELRKPVEAFSGGMKRRLSLAMAIMHEPEILILDEPTVGIDPLLRQSIWRELRKLTNQGVTIIVTTHVMDEAEKCDYLTMMRDGLLISQGTPQEIQDGIGASSIEEAFIYYSRDTSENEKMNVKGDIDEN